MYYNYKTFVLFVFFVVVAIGEYRKKVRFTEKNLKWQDSTTGNSKY